VCVWDDLVDIPVAVPMSAPTSAMRRRREEAESSNTVDEMDISAANASAPQPDLLGLGSPSAELPNPNRFELSTGGSPRASEESSRLRSPEPLSDIMNGGILHNSTSKAGGVKFSDRPAVDRSSTRLSYSGPARTLPTPRRENRRFSFSHRRGSATSHTMYDGDDHEGDLGYAAAEDMEGNLRKVIVERLETVKGRNPVFTWC